MSAKDILLRPISAQEANALVRRVHYSGKVVNNSQLHIGVFWQGRLEGAMQFGPSIDKRKMLGLVEGTQWNEFVELNRLAFTDALPRNSESRALSVAIRLLREHAPHLKWIVSFADATQCGDGAIYRAAGFLLTGIKKNSQVWQHDTGITVSRTALTNLGHNGALKQRRELSSRFGVDFTNLSGASMREYEAVGFRPLTGYQLRYIYFLDPSCRERLTVPILPYSEIERRGAGMYRGQPRAESIAVDASAFHAEEGGSIPTSALQEQAAH